MSDFSSYLIALRGARSKTEIERLAKVKRASILRAESGDRLLRLSTLKRLIVFYGGDIEEAVRLMARAREERDQRKVVNG